MASPFRKKITSWLVLGMLGLAVLAMVVTGFGTDGLGGVQPTGQALASVSGRKVTETELSDQVNRAYRNAQQEQPELDLGTFVGGGAVEQILDQLIIGHALMAFGEDQGMVVSPRMIDKEIVNIPAFRNFAGQFDETTFRQALASQNITEAQLRDDIARSLMQRQLLLPIAASARIPEGMAREYAALLLERRQGSIGVVPSELMGRGIEPTPEEVAAFYRDNRSRFTIPERRVIRYALLGPDELGGAAQPTEQEIEAVYRQTPAYRPQEKRRLQQVVLPDAAAARGFAQRLQGGADFLAAARQAGYSVEDVTLGAQTREQFAGLASPEAAQAAFSAAQGAVVGPVRSELGFHVIRVEAIESTPARPLASVRADIARQIQGSKRTEALGALINRVEDQLAEGASFEEVVRTERLTPLQTPPITATGQAPGQTWQLPEDVQPLLRGAFELPAEDPEPVVETLVPNERFALLSVGQVIPAAAPPLAQIRDEVRSALIGRRALDRARAVAASIVAKINSGASPQQAFAQAGNGLPAPQPVDVKRMEISQGGQRVPPPLAMLFSLPEGKARLLQAPGNAGWFVVHHRARTAGDPAEQPGLIEATRSQFSGMSGDELARQFARAVEMGMEVRRNEDAIRALRARLEGRVDAP